MWRPRATWVTTTVIPRGRRLPSGRPLAAWSQPRMLLVLLEAELQGHLVRALLSTPALDSTSPAAAAAAAAVGAVPLPLGETVMAVGQTSHSRFDHSSGVVAHSPTAPAAVPLPQISRRSRPPTRREVCKTTNLPYCSAVLFCAYCACVCQCVTFVYQIEKRKSKETVFD